jgi:hypothetical protein
MNNCLLIFNTYAQIGCNIMHWNLSVFQNQLLDATNVHICDGCRLHANMWSVNYLFTAFRKVSSPYCALNLWRISANFTFSFAGNLIIQRCSTLGVTVWLHVVLLMRRHRRYGYVWGSESNVPSICHEECFDIFCKKKKSRSTLNHPHTYPDHHNLLALINYPNSAWIIVKMWNFIMQFPPFSH